ncbi:hypothetical protein Btru_073755 [Bulinus truncatus]|nr:hypothetical protein Btru_073755 [Bulinus truncatus]
MYVQAEIVKVRITILFIKINRINWSLRVTTGHCESLLVTASHYWSLRVSTGHCESLPVTASHYWSLRVTTGQRESLLVTASQYWSPRVTTGHCESVLVTANNSPEGQSEPSFAHGLAVGAAAVVLLAVVFVLVYRRQNQKIQELISQHKDNVYTKPNVPHEEFSLYEGLNPDINMKENVLCDVGYYGTNCTSPCPTNCKTGECHVQTGQCIAGCKAGYVGVKCENHT